MDTESIGVSYLILFYPKARIWVLGYMHYFDFS